MFILFSLSGQAQQGEVAIVADLADPGYALELSSPVPSVGLVSIVFPFLISPFLGVTVGCSV